MISALRLEDLDEDIGLSIRACSSEVIVRSTEPVRINRRRLCDNSAGCIGGKILEEVEIRGEERSVVSRFIDGAELSRLTSFAESTEIEIENIPDFTLDRRATKQYIAYIISKTVEHEQNSKQQHTNFVSQKCAFYYRSVMGRAWL